MNLLSSADIEDMRETLKAIGQESERYYDSCTEQQIVEKYDRITMDPLLTRKERKIDEQ